MKKSSPHLLVSALGSLLWLVIVSMAYVYTHKAFSAEMLLALLSFLGKIFLSFAVISLSAGLGLKLIKLLSVEGLPLALALGLGAFSVLILGVGIWIGVIPWLFFAILEGFLLWLWRDILHFWRQAWQAWQVLSFHQVADKILALISAAILLLNLQIAAAPPLAFDALVYHLSLPLRYIDAGKIFHVADNIFTGMPQLAEMNYLFVFVLGGETAPAIFGWLLAVLTLLFIGQYLANKFSPGAGWFAIAALLSGFSLSRLTGQAYIEWFLLFYGFAWWLALEKAVLEKETGRWLLALGAISGFALSLKYTAGLLILLACLALVFQKQGWRAKMRSLVLFGLTASLFSLPWWIKNFFWTGNPFYPLLFASAEMDALRLGAFNAPPLLSWFDLPTFPWYVTIWGAEGKVGPSASIGPLLLAFAPLAYWGWDKKSAGQRGSICLASFILLAGFIVWYLAGSQNGLLEQTRLFVTLFPVWALLAAAGFSTLADINISSVRLERIGLAIALMFLSFNLLETLADTLPRRATETNLGFLSRESYLQLNLGDLHLANQALQSLGPDLKVVMLWETRGFYCSPSCDPDEIIDRWYHETRQNASPQAILKNWQIQGYTHLLIYDWGVEFVREFDNAKYNSQDWVWLAQLRQSLGPGQKIGDYTLYRLTP
jgi:hypothetical protein